MIFSAKQVLAAANKRTSVLSWQQIFESLGISKYVILPDGDRNFKLRNARADHKLVEKVNAILLDHITNIKPKNIPDDYKFILRYKQDQRDMLIGIDNACCGPFSTDRLDNCMEVTYETLEDSDAENEEEENDQDNS